MKHRALLGIDLGTSAIKALVVDRADGRTLGLERVDYPIDRPSPGFAEQSPDTWWHAAVNSVRHALATAGHPPIDAIGITGQMHGTVLLDANAQLLGPAIIWADRRSAAEATEIEASIDTELIEHAGSRMAAGLQAATLRWLRRHRPELFAAIAVVVLPKDYLRFRLTHEFVTEPSDASGTLLFDIRTRTWSPMLAAAAGIRLDQLPAIVPSTEISGHLHLDAALELGLPPGTPVAAGAGDAPAAAVGAGVIRPNDFLLSLSSGAQIYTPLAQPIIDRSGRTHTFASALDSQSPAPWYAMGATLNAGTAVNWLEQQWFGPEERQRSGSIGDLAAEGEAGAGGLLFLPYLDGERTPHFDPVARGAFIGLTSSHSREDLARSVLEGITFATLDAFESVRSASKVEPQSIVLAGGGSGSTVWRQIVADQFGLPVRSIRGPEQSALGAAMLAGAATGDPVEDLVQHWIRPDEPVLPSLDAHERYRELFPLFRRAWNTNRDTMHALAKWRQAGNRNFRPTDSIG